MEFDFYNTKKKANTNIFKSKVFDEIQDALFVFTISADNDYDIPFINDVTYEMFEVLSNVMFTDTVFSIYDRIHKEDKKLVVNSLFDAIKKRRKWSVEFRAELPLNGLSWFKVTSKRMVNKDGSSEFCGRIRDITEFKEQELRLKRTEERFKFMLETSNAGIWDWDLKTNRFCYSPQSLNILEWKSSDISNTQEGWNKIMHPDDREAYTEALKDHFNNKTPFFENFMRVLTSDQKYKWILSKGMVVERDAAGRSLKIIGTHSDVSFQKEKELELKRELEVYKERNNRLLNFSHIVSHNLNAHAGNFKVLLDLIDSEESFDDKVETIKYLRAVSGDLSKTIEDLSQIVNVQNNTEINVETLNLNSYLSRVLNIVNAYSESNNVTILKNVSPEAVVRFNPAYLESVLQNLSTNAIKYADPEKPLIVEFNFFIENGKKTFTVKDNGLGIDLEKYGNLIFGMYKTFHKNEKANGLGLYITKNQIESMNGKITVESKVGVGTTFKIVFND
ncbi:sensor histidine kinase [Flavobacterium sp. ABG]|uniref:sensor histidine kinase n=1 Tax=Flavobacterium sp. ABG TaxID=1423322 RepID=UPI00064A337F|nr:PAS domain-containing protein [Flavobacterium sp. ABG]KLT68014.1 histidine kinase [Flavobacterium sp. ABG]